VPGASLGHGTVSRKSLVDKGVRRRSKGVKGPVEESPRASLMVIWSKLSSSPMVFSDKNTYLPIENLFSCITLPIHFLLTAPGISVMELFLSLVVCYAHPDITRNQCPFVRR